MSFIKFPCLSSICFISLLSQLHAQYSGPATGQKVEFLGDSITQFGWDGPGGYVHLVDTALAQEGHKIEVIPAGISGQTSKDMLARIGDVLSKKPDWLLISCGVNDVWHGAQGVPLDQYKINITSMVDQARAAGAKVVILASTPIGFNLTDANNTMLVGYNDFLRGLAAKDNLTFVELNDAMVKSSTDQLKQTPHPYGDMVTQDGVHPNAIGNEIMATGIVKAWGLTDAQVAQCTAGWQQIPNAFTVGLQAGMTVHDYLLLLAYARSQNKSVFDVLNGFVTDGIKKAVEGVPTATP